MSETNDTDQLRKRIEQLEADLIAQEHRPTHIVYRFIRQRTLYANEPDKRTAVYWSLISGLLFSSTSIAVGSSLLAVLLAITTATLTYDQVIAMREANRIALGEFSQRLLLNARIVDAHTNDNELLRFQVLLSNSGVEPVYFDMVTAEFFIKALTTEKLVSGIHTKGYHFVQSLKPSGECIVQPKSFEVVEFFVKWSDFESTAFDSGKSDTALSALKDVLYPNEYPPYIAQLELKPSEGIAMSALVTMSASALDGSKISGLSAVVFHNDNASVGDENGKVFEAVGASIWPVGPVSLKPDGALNQYANVRSEYMKAFEFSNIHLSMEKSFKELEYLRTSQSEKMDTSN